MREIFGSFSLHTNRWKLPLFTEKEFKSFHISDGIFIYIFILIWLRDLPGTAIHAPSDDIGRLWAGRKKRGLLSIVRHQVFAKREKAGMPEIQLLGNHPRIVCAFIPAVGRKQPFFLQKFHPFVLTNSSNAYSWERGENTTIKCQISSQIHEVEIRGKIRVKRGFVQR